MHIIGRLLMILLAYCLASLAAGFTIVLLRLIVAAFIVRLPLGIVGEVVLWVVMASVLSGMFAVLPAVVIIALAEARRLRSPAFYGAAGAVTGSACGGVVVLMSSTRMLSADGIFTLLFFSIYFAVSGLIAGLVYWGIAGKTAGAWGAPSEAGGRAPTDAAP